MRISKFLAIAALCALAPHAPAPRDSSTTHINPINSDQQFPRIAWNGDSEWLVIYLWDPAGPVTGGLWGHRLPLAGTAGSDFLISGAGSSVYPALHHSPTSECFLVVWEEDGNLLGRRVGDTSGTGLIGTTINVSDSGALIDSNPRIAYNSDTDEFLVVWVRGDTYLSGEVRGQIVRGDGTLNGGSFVISGPGDNFRSPSADYSTSDDAYLVAWEQTRGWARRINANGTPKSDPFNIEDSGVNSAGHPAMAYAPSINRFLIAYEFMDGIRTRLAFGVNPVSGSQFVSVPQTIEDTGGIDEPELTWDESRDGWFMAGEHGDSPWQLRGAWVRPNGVPFQAFPVSARGEAIAVAHSGPADGASQIVWTQPTSSSFGTFDNVVTRPNPEHMAWNSSFGATTTADFLTATVNGAGWNIYHHRPGLQRSGELNLYSDLFSTLLDSSATEGDVGTPPALIAVDGSLVTTPMHAMVTIGGTDPAPTTRNDFVSGQLGSVGALTVPAHIEGVSASLNSSPVQIHTAHVTSGSSYVITVIPKSGNGDYALALFDSNPSIVATAYQDLGEAGVSDLDSPERGADLFFGLATSDDVGVAVITLNGNGTYDLIYRQSTLCTSDEILAYLLGLISEPQGANVDGVPPVNAADLVAAINLGR